MSFDASVAKATLATFRRRKKLSDAEWRKRGLVPSSAAVSASLETLFNELASRLIAVSSEAKPSLAADSLLREALHDVDRDDYDTEEAEFVCTLFASLAKVFELQFGRDLNSWLYGEALGNAASDQAEREEDPKAIQTLSQPCTKCGAALETAITSSRPDNDSESWLAIECAVCHESNFLVLPPGIGSMRPNGYKMTTQYWRSQFDRETAEAAFKEAHAKQAKTGPRSKRRGAA